MTEFMNQPVTISDLHEAQAAAEQQLSGVGEQIRARESRLRGLASAGLTDEQHAQAREQICTEHRALIEQQRMIEEWVSRLQHTAENFELRMSTPRADLKRDTLALAAIDERLTA